MNLPKNFIPNRKSLVEQTEKLSQLDPADLISVIHEGLNKAIVNSEPGHCYYHVTFEFNEETEVVLYFTSKPYHEDKLTCIDKTGLGLKSVKITSVVDDTIEAIENVFYKNDLGSIKVSSPRTAFNMKERTIPEVKRRFFRKSEQEICGNLLYINRLGFAYHMNEESITLFSGIFSRISGKKICNYMSIYEVLPFTEEEKDLMSSLESFGIMYRFPRPNQSEFKHILEFEIKKSEERYALSMRIAEGYLSGLDLESLWPAKNVVGYLNSKHRITLLEEEISSS